MIFAGNANLLVAVVLVSVSMSLFLLLVIFFNRINQLWLEKRLLAGIERLLPHFEGFILGQLEPEDFRELALHNRPAAHHLTLRYLSLLKGRTKHQILDVAEGIGFVSQAMKNASSFSWKKREISAMELGVYGHAGAVEVLQKLVGDRCSEVRHTALRSMSLLDSSLAFGALIELLERPTQIDVARIMEIVREINNPNIEVLNQKLLDSSLPLLTRLFLIDLVGEWGEYRVTSTLHTLTKDDNVEIVIRSIKSMGRIGSEASIPHLIGLIDHEAWEVRAQVIRAIATFEYMEALQLIANCLTDRAYWVRRAAAEVLVSLGPEGESWLQPDQLPDDPFARDIAHYVLFRRSLTMEAADIPQGQGPQPGDLQTEQS